MNHTLMHAVVVSSLALTSFAGQPEATKSTYQEMIEYQVSPAIEGELIPGAVIGIYKDGQTSFHPIGTLNFDQDQSPTTDTLYEIGSISKVITGVLFADAVRRGEVSNDTLVGDLLPDGYEVQTEEGDDLKLWHLTTHTSGWSTAPINLAPTDGERPFTGYTPKMLFEAVNIWAPKGTPGESFEYSNFAVGLLGTLVSINATTERENEYESLVIERVLEPLGIDNFVVGLNDEQLTNLAPATSSGRTTKAWGKTGPMDPAGMWVTNAPGLMGFAIANIEGGDSDIHESLKLSREPLFTVEGMGKICSGWFISGDGSTYWHNGMTGGYSSYMAVNPTHDVAVVILANGAAFETTIIGEKIIQSVMGMDPEPIEIEIHEKLEASYTDRIVGVYRSTFGFDMTITSTRGKIFAQITGQQALALTPVSENRFAYRAVQAEIEFTLPDEGNASSVTLFQNGMEMKCERVE